MRITSVALENIKSYQKIRVPFSGGTIAIRGHNGAGKSTLVEAIGFALFDALPYSQDQFVREGERYGVVTVSFISAEDDREYQAVRRCGTSPNWYIYDPELQMRVVEQKTDVSDFLRRHLRIETDLALRDLFNDALGVPQGTFTADFLLSPANRKKKFDALLQVEDYQKAAEKLRDTRTYLQEQRRSVELRIGNLAHETDQLDGWRSLLRDLHEEERSITALLERFKQESIEVEARLTVLRQQKDDVRELARKAERASDAYANTEKLLQNASRQLEEAREAVHVCAETKSDYQQNLAAQQQSQQATQRARSRDELRQRQAKIAQQHTVVDRDLHHTQQQFADARKAEQDIVALLPAVDQQDALERQRDEAQRQLERSADIQQRLVRTQQQQQRLAKSIQECEKSIVALEALRPEAAQLDERREHVTMLQDQRARQSERKKRLSAITAEQQEAATLREKAVGNEARLQENVRKIHANQSVAEALPTLEEQCRASEDKLRRIEVRRDQHQRSREASGGGNCPFLHEPCLNIQRKGMSNLSGYFDSLIAQEEQAHATISTELEQLEAQREHARTVRKYYDRLDVYEQQLQDATQQRQAAEKRLAQLAAEQLDIETQERLAPGASDLAAAQKAFRQSDDADKQLRELSPRQDELARLIAQQTETQTDATTLQQELATLEPARVALEQVIAALQALDDPRAKRSSLQRIADARMTHETAVSELTKQMQALQAQLARLDTELVAYAGLDAEIAAIEQLQSNTQAGYLRHLHFKSDADKYPERQTEVARITSEAQAAQQQLAQATQAYQAASAAFDEAALTQAEERHDALKKADSDNQAELRQRQGESKRLGDEINRVEALLVTLAAEREEYGALEDLERMLQYFRDTIKEAGPNIMKALLREISTQANRIFGEIMGDRSAELAWTNDYEVVLRRDGQERTFAQLSGGEQMSAALAVRLALLRRLTRLDIAFFDEPTQNMDGERRGNLAEQIRRVRGFDQLIVISHDDTFEQGLDSVIHLEKRDGKTVLAELEDGMLVPA